MKINELNQHCGRCNIIDYCDEPYANICICCDSRFKDVEEEKFLKLAETSKRKSKVAIINDVVKRLNS